MNKRTLCLSLLRRAGSNGVTTGEFLEAGVGSRYGARVCELRKQGYVIHTTRISDGQFHYLLDRKASEASVSELGTEAPLPSVGASTPAPPAGNEEAPAAGALSPGGGLFDREAFEQRRNPVAPDLAA